MGQRIPKSRIKGTLRRLRVHLRSLRVRSRLCLLGAGGFGKWRVHLGRGLLAGLKIRTRRKIRTRTRKKTRTRTRTRKRLRKLRGNFRHRHLPSLPFPIYRSKHPLPSPKGAKGVAIRSTLALPFQTILTKKPVPKLGHLKNRLPPPLMRCPPLARFP